MKHELGLTIVVPLYNEELVVPALCEAFRKKRNILPKQTELIFVNDGSTDQTKKLLNESSPKEMYTVKVVSLSRNFGHQAALLAGLEASKSEVTVTMDGDLQHPIDVIPQMLSHHLKGIDIVQTQRLGDEFVGPVKKFTSTIFYRFFSLLSQTSIEHNCSDFRSMNRRSLDALLKLKENRKFLRGMVQWIGFSSITIPYQVGQRNAGKSKYSLAKMIKLSVVGITSFSSLPLYISVLFCLASIGASIIYAVYVIYVKLALGTVVSGWTSMILVLLMMSSALFFVLSLYGVYLSAIFDELKRRPQYVISEID